MRAAGIESEMELPFAIPHQLCVPILNNLVPLPEIETTRSAGAYGRNEFR